MRRIAALVLCAFLLCPAGTALSEPANGPDRGAAGDGSAEITWAPRAEARSGARGLAPTLAEWPGAPCINDADCGALKCCDKVCAESCRNAGVTLRAAWGAPVRACLP